MGRRPLPKRLAPFVPPPLTSGTSWGISSPFELLSPALGQVAHALLTRSPLEALANSPFDLHVLGTPPAFILSQDQTLRKNCPCCHGSFLLHWNSTGSASNHSSVVKVLTDAQRHSETIP